MSTVSAIIVLTLIMDPIGNAPLFRAVLGNLAPERRVRVIVRELLIALFILAAFLFFGPYILHGMNVSSPALSIAGGVVLFLVAIRMIFPARDGLGLAGAGDDAEPFIVPLAMPMIAGPGTMAMVILFATREPDRMVDWSLALLVAWAIAAVVLVSSEFLLRVIHDRGQRALVRLMGMILTAMAVQMLLNGVGEFLTGLPQAATAAGAG